MTPAAGSRRHRRRSSARQRVYPRLFEYDRGSRAAAAGSADAVRWVPALFSLRMKPELKQRAEKAAAEESRSLSSLIEVLLAQHCKQREESSRILKGVQK